jgi:hypothetical protein
MWPRLEDAAKAALASVLTLHGPLILATAEGRELADEADRMRLTRGEQAGLREDVRILACALKRDVDVIEPPAADLVGNATETMGEGPHPERGTVFGLAALKNVAVVLVSAATVISAAMTATGLMGPAAGAGATWIALEGLKKSKAFLSAVVSLGGEYDRLLRLIEGQAELAQTQIVARVNALAPFHQFIITNEEPLRRIAFNTTQLRWMLPYIDFIVGTNREGNKEQSFR